MGKGGRNRGGGAWPYRLLMSPVSCQKAGHLVLELICRFTPAGVEADHRSLSAPFGGGRGFAFGLSLRSWRNRRHARCFASLALSSRGAALPGVVSSAGSASLSKPKSIELEVGRASPALCTSRASASSSRSARSPSVVEEFDRLRGRCPGLSRVHLRVDLQRPDDLVLNRVWFDPRECAHWEELGKT